MAAESGAGEAEHTPSSSLGRRVRVSGKLATVRWGPGHLQAPPPRAAATASVDTGAEAPSAPATVEVVGIEYDEAGLGKHDGTYQGKRLFECPDGHGSFAKLEKIEWGVSVQRALAEKYFTALLPEAASKSTRAEAVDAVEYVDSKGRQKTMSVDLVGRYGVEQRQQRLEGFVEIALAETCLETRYPEDVWEGDWSLPNLKSMWLDKSLIGEWPDVVALCELCPHLEWLSLTKTRLAPLSPDAQLPAPRGVPSRPRDDRLVLQPFVCRVRTLVLNSTMVTWQTLLAVDGLALFPSLEHLHLAHNDLAEGVPDFEHLHLAHNDLVEGNPDFRQGRRPFPKLRSLVLDGNGISDWRVLRRAVVAFPGLEALHLNANLLGNTLEGLSDMASDMSPRRLTALFLTENRLGSWRAVGALSQYALLELKAQRIPLTEGDAPVSSPMLLRQVLIALMPTLLRLNASEVTVKERTAAERYFLSIVQQKESSVIQGLSESCDLGEHAARLRAVHGEVVGGGGSEEAQASRSALANALVEVTLTPVASAIVEQAPVKKRVPHTMTVAELKKLCQLLFKQVPLSRVRLVLSDPALPFGLPFEDENRELGFYGIGDGAEVHVGDVADGVGAAAT